MKKSPSPEPILLPDRAAATTKLHVAQWPIARPKPYPNNPRLISDDAVAKVAASIQRYGWRSPIVVDEHDVVLAGHTRLLAARQLELKTVPVHIALGLTVDEANAYRLADNRTGEESEWDLEKLAFELKDLPADLPTGFDADEIEKLLLDELDDGEPDAVPDVDEARPAVSKLGEMYELGPHRLMCGDSTSADAVATLMGGERANLLLTDPPYNVAYTGKTKDAMTIDNDAMDAGAFREFLVKAMTTAIAAMAEGAAFYVWHADSAGFAFRGACEDVGLQVRQCLIWAKSSLVLGRQDYHWRHEPCLYGWKAGASHTWLSDRTQTTLLEFDRPARNGEHPTMKPVALFEYQMRNSCPVNGVVLDLFGGSGTTLIAAAKSARQARLMELDPRYCDVIRKRWTRFARENGKEPGSGALDG